MVCSSAMLFFSHEFAWSFCTSLELERFTSIAFIQNFRLQIMRRAYITTETGMQFYCILYLKLMEFFHPFEACGLKFLFLCC
uniref:Uncharacterized protein n=1 Tax=Arundo donax TaxID=35708 RepID=A0A0A9GLG0_ARUDO